ncbi:MAG: tRNA lysidine(34) synthetase TilS [Paracoccaceae bacterium]
MSGGGDSMAMLHLAVAAGVPVRVVTVDHGLRAEAAAEAVAVARVCAGLGVLHEVLRWHWDKRGNLQDAARRGRRLLIGDWAKRAGLAAVALGHTQDDLAETFVMRLARGAGVDGLSAMSARWEAEGVTWVRPLLTVSRGELRDYLRGIGVAWADDPSNENVRFDRVKARQALRVLEPLGVTAARLAEVAGHLAEARDALEGVADLAAVHVLRAEAGVVRISAQGLSAQPAEVQRRLVLRVIQWIAPAEYGPRGTAVTALLARLLAGKPGVLAGCRFIVGKGGIVAFREGKAVEGVVCGLDQLWDGRWRALGPLPEGAEVRALGAGIALCPEWRATGLPRAALMAGPSLWLGVRLIAAPLAGLAPEFSFIPLPGAAALHQSSIVH